VFDDFGIVELALSIYDRQSDRDIIPMVLNGGFRLKSKVFAILVFCLVTVSCVMFSSEAIEVPIKSDSVNGDLFILQFPLTLGLPFDFGLGMKNEIPMGVIYAFKEEKREKRVFFKDQTVETKRIKVMWGLSDEFVYEFRYQHFFNDSISLAAIGDAIGIPAPSIRLPLTFSLDLRTFGTAQNPVFVNEGFAFSKAGPVSANITFHSYNDIFHNHGITEIGLRVMDQPEFGLTLGDLTGVFGSIDMKTPAMSYRPRLAAGYSRQTGSLTIGLLLHDEASVGQKSSIKLNTMLLFPVNGKPFWSIQGDYKLSRFVEIYFNLSLENATIGNRTILDLSSLVNNDR